MFFVLPGGNHCNCQMILFIIWSLYPFPKNWNTVYPLHFHDPLPSYSSPLLRRTAGFPFGAIWTCWVTLFGAILVRNKIIDFQLRNLLATINWNPYQTVANRLKTWQNVQNKTKGKKTINIPAITHFLKIDIRGSSLSH